MFHVTKILSLKSFGNIWDNLYTVFLILDIQYRFTLGCSRLYQKITKFQNIMSKIVDLNIAIEIK